MEQDSYYCTVIDTTKGRIVFRLNKHLQDYAAVVLQILQKSVETHNSITAVTPGLLQLKLGKWPSSAALGSAAHATIIRGSLSVTSPTAGSICNLLLARIAAPRIERLYVQLGWVQTGLDVVDELRADDCLTDIYWALFGQSQSR